MYPNVLTCSLKSDFFRIDCKHLCCTNPIFHSSFRQKVTVLTKAGAQNKTMKVTLRCYCCSEKPEDEQINGQLGGLVIYHPQHIVSPDTPESEQVELVWVCPKCSTEDPDWRVVIKRQDKFVCLFRVREGSEGFLEDTYSEIEEDNLFCDCLRRGCIRFCNALLPDCEKFIHSVKNLMKTDHSDPFF